MFWKNCLFKGPLFYLSLQNFILVQVFSQPVFDNGEQRYNHVEGSVLSIDLSGDSVTGIMSSPEMDIAIHPNPFKDRLLINVNWTKGEKLKLVVYDLAGNPVYILPAKYHAARQHAVELNLELLAAGLYVGKVEIGQQEVF